MAQDVEQVASAGSHGLIARSAVRTVLEQARSCHGLFAPLSLLRVRQHHPQRGAPAANPWAMSTACRLRGNKSRLRGNKKDLEPMSRNTAQPNSLARSLASAREMKSTDCPDWPVALRTGRCDSTRSGRKVTGMREIDVALDHDFQPGIHG